MHPLQNPPEGQWHAVTMAASFFCLFLSMRQVEALPMLARGKVGMDYTPCFYVSQLLLVWVFGIYLTSWLIHHPFTVKVFTSPDKDENISSAMSFNIPAASLHKKLSSLSLKLTENTFYYSFPPRVQVFLKMFSKSVQLDS